MSRDTGTGGETQLTGVQRERFLAYIMELQFAVNCLASVAIEYPALRKHPLLRGTA